MKNLCIAILLSIVTTSISAQDILTDLYRIKSAEPPAGYNYIPKKPGQYTAEDWRAIIDNTWGEGLSTEKKLQIFDDVYDAINDEFACFQGLNVDMDSLRESIPPGN